MRVIRCCLLLLATVGSDAYAQAYPATYPTKPIRILVGYSAGGTGDISARMLAQKMTEQLGQNVIIENRPGAGGAIADEAIARAAPDGYNLLYAAGSSAILPALRKSLSYHVERDFAPVSLVVLTSFVLAVHPSVPARDVKSYLALAKRSPGSLKFSSPGVGSSAHFAAEIAHMMAGAKLLHVPFRGPPEAMSSLVSGEVDAGYPSVTVASPYIQANRIRGLAVSTATRAALLPNVPTLAESGLAGYERMGWNGVLAPANTAREIITRLNGVVVKSVALPEIRETFIKQGLEPRANTPEEFAAFIKREVAQNARVVAVAGMKVE